METQHISTMNSVSEIEMSVTEFSEISMWLAKLQSCVKQFTNIIKPHNSPGVTYICGFFLIEETETQQRN